MLTPFRSRAVPMLAAVVLLAAAGCAVPDNDPESYDDEVRASYMQGCTGDVPETGGTTTTLASTGYCECTYEVFVANVPYDETDREERRDDDGERVFADYPEDAPTFTELNSELSGRDTDESDDAALRDLLPESVLEALDACSDGETPAPAGPTTTAPDVPDDEVTGDGETETETETDEPTEPAGQDETDG